MHIPILNIDIPPRKNISKINGLDERKIEALRKYLPKKIIAEALIHIGSFQDLRARAIANNLNLKDLNKMHEILLELLITLNDNPYARKNKDNEELVRILDEIEDEVETIEEQVDSLKDRIMN
ncbi:hypothetical protein J4476_03635 [Candidatus Woesearchaeota archaeon]|nr:MAG: hypothetical protein QT09_C0007G0012 [archaeon GW2011_AR18]MBS3161759.1 hypothetical protein [Candidatus Woesearchaeota archaeon]HIH25426.1 hypothetical protein [Nanoarchaeota archaeon]